MGAPSDRPGAPAGWRGARAGGAGALYLALVAAGLAVGALLRAINLGGPAFGFDEFYDVFAAKSLLAGGGQELPHGSYSRARLSTLLTALAFSLFGESEGAARLPALLFGVLALVLVYVVGRALFGPAAGLVALWLMALSPEAIDVSRFARLYSPLVFLTLLAAFAAYRALEGGGGETPQGPRLTRGRLAWAGVAVITLLVARELHTAAVGLVVVVQAYAAVMGAAALARGRRGAALRYGAVAAALLCLEALAIADAGTRARLARVALSPLPWYTPTPGDSWLYYNDLAARYGWLWYLTLPATVLVVAARPRPGLFTALAFWVPFAAISAAVATKHPRYIVHTLPFAWLLLGAAAGLLWAAARRALAAGATVSAARPPPAWLVTGALAAALAAAALTPSVPDAVRRPWQVSGTHFTTSYYYDWRGLARALEGRLPPDARVVAGGGLAVPYYLGRPVYRLVGPDRPNGERRGRLEEARVQRAGQLAELRAGGQPVWVVVERWRWEEPARLDPGLKAALVSDCQPPPLAAPSDFVLFACDARGEAPPPRSGTDPRGAPSPR